MGSSSQLYVDAALVSSVVDCMSSNMKVPRDAFGALGVVGNDYVYSEFICLSFSLILLLIFEILLENYLLKSSASLLYDEHSGSGKS